MSDATPSRRHVLSAAAAAASAAALAFSPAADAADDAPAGKPAVTRPNRIGISTYSFWQFQHQDLRDIEKCIDMSAEWGFDAVELLHRQMSEEWPGNGYL